MLFVFFGATRSVYVMRKATDEEFRDKVLQIMDEEIVQKFVKREGNADAYYAEPEDLTVPHK